MGRRLVGARRRDRHGPTQRVPDLRGDAEKYVGLRSGASSEEEAAGWGCRSQETKQGGLEGQSKRQPRAEPREHLSDSNGLSLHIYFLVLTSDILRGKNHLPQNHAL